ncbi:hypothetical protein G9A89_021003 [Geosiphon pyriformis]|nr:hypothetical protein G9A89_021003 [Geosiphon pyriformis]
MSLFILDDMIVDESSDSHENKRVKITTACDTCRRRKVKCDGASPCANCQRGGYQCTFSDASTKRPRGPPKGFVALIEDRLHTIESLLVNLVNKDNNDNKEIKQEREQPIEETSERRRYNTFKVRYYSPSNAITPAKNTQHLFIPNTPPADANSLPEHQHNQAFAASFGDDLASDDEDDVQKNLAGCTANNYQNSTLYLLHQPGSYHDPPLPNTIPQNNPLPQDVMNQLLEKYFTHFHPFFPIINRAQLYRQLQSVDDQPSPLLMNAIYAVGALYPPILQDAYSPMTFYDRARNLLDYFIDAPRLSTVQALILLCMVDQGKTTSYRPQTYSFMAIRMAQSMGLNRKNGAVYHQSKNRHTKKLVWWSCFILDRLHSLATGDPLTINEEACDIEFPLPEESDDQQGDLQPNAHNTPHSQTVTIFVHFIRLAQLMGQIISHLQSAACTGIPTTSWAHHNMISCYEAALVSWVRELPPYLQFPPAGQSTPLGGQIAALHMHYHTLNIMLHYPYLASHHSRSTGPRISKTYLKSLNVCTTAANIISHIGAVSLNNVYVCLTYPTMFHCLTQAAKVHVINITSADRGLAHPAYKNIFRTIEICQFYVDHGVMAELGNQTIKALEGVLRSHRERYAFLEDSFGRVEGMIPSSSAVPSSVPHIKVSPTLASQMFVNPIPNGHNGPSTLSIPSNSFGPYSSPASTHLSSPTTDAGSRSPNINHTPNFTYVAQQQHTQPATQAFLPVSNGVSSNTYSSEEFFDTTVSPTNMMASVNNNGSELGSGDQSFWEMGMNFPGAQPISVGFSNAYETSATTSPVNISATVYSPQHLQLRHHASPPLSNASSLSSSASSSSSYKHHRSNNHPSLDSIDDLAPEDPESALINDVLANVQGIRSSTRSGQS